MKFTEGNMASVVGNEDANDIQEFVDRYFNSDSEGENEDFDGGDVEEAIRRAREVRFVDLNTPMNDDEKDIDLTNGWTKEDGDNPLIAPFTGDPGLLVDVPDREPIDFFNLLFKAEMWELLVDETNRYANQRQEDGQFSR